MTDPRPLTSVITATAAAFAAVAGCTSRSSPSPRVDETPAAAHDGRAAAGPPQIANPAAQYCLDHGGRFEVRKTDAGETGYCVFPDGSECDAWAFFRGECGPKNQPK